MAMAWLIDRQGLLRATGVAIEAVIATVRGRRLNDPIRPSKHPKGRRDGMGRDQGN